MTLVPSLPVIHSGMFSENLSGQVTNDQHHDQHGRHGRTPDVALD